MESSIRFSSPTPTSGVTPQEFFVTIDGDMSQTRLSDPGFPQWAFGRLVISSGTGARSPESKVKSPMGNLGDSSHSVSK